MYTRCAAPQCRLRLDLDEARAYRVIKKYMGVFNFAVGRPTFRNKNYAWVTANKKAEDVRR